VCSSFPGTGRVGESVDLEPCEHKRASQRLGRAQDFRQLGCAAVCHVAQLLDLPGVLRRCLLGVGVGMLAQPGNKPRQSTRETIHERRRSLQLLAGRRRPN